MSCENRAEKTGREYEIIDVHIHITPGEIISREKKYRKDEPYFDLLSSNPKNKFATADEVVAEMDKRGVDRAVVFGFAFQNQDNCRFVNDYTLASVEKYPERLAGMAVVNPLAEGAAAEVRRCLEAGLEGVGELFPEGQGFDLKSRSQLEEIAEICREFAVPLMVHLNEPVGHEYPGKTCDSIECGATLAENFPDNHFIFSHWGGGLFFYELMPEMRESLKNVYYDTAASPFLYDRKIYQAAKSVDLLNKVLLGSDFPLISPGKYLEEMKEAELSQAEISRIAGENARELFDF